MRSKIEDEKLVKAAEKLTGDARELTRCGIIMPISKTTSHSAEHWADVQSLLHRAVREAGFAPENVWEGDLTDRVSERIVANIFSHELMIVDASDLNPNVMLELGLRLSSKRPTVVVCDNLAALPFDIRDFRAVSYPSDLNILGMEKFFAELGRALQSKFEAYKNHQYEPFLGGVIVEVVQPETKEISLDNAILDRMDELLRRVSRLESPRRKYTNASRDDYPSSDSSLQFIVPVQDYHKIIKFMTENGLVFDFYHSSEKVYFNLPRFMDYSRSIHEQLSQLLAECGGTLNVSEEAKRRFGS